MILVILRPRLPLAQERLERKPPIKPLMSESTKRATGLFVPPFLHPLVLQYRRVAEGNTEGTRGATV